MVHFVGAGCGAPDLITVRGARLLAEADLVLYTGSLVNPALLDGTKPGCEARNTACMTLEEVLAAIEAAEVSGKTTVRLHTGDPCLYGAIREQMDALDARGITYDVTPGVSSFCGAAAALHAEYTLPGVSQTLILTRMAGRTPVPARESIRTLAVHRSSMAIFLSASMAAELASELQAGGYPPDTPAAIACRVSFSDEQLVRCTVGTLGQAAQQAGITRTALILVGDFLGAAYDRSKLYDPAFSTGWREASK